MIGIVITIYTLYYAPSRAYLPWVLAWAVLVAGYFAWRTDHVRLQQRIRITKVLTQTWKTQWEQDATAYYLEVVNTGEALSISGVRVQLAEIGPEVVNLNWLPVLLRQKHDNPLPGIEYSKKFDLNPSEPKHIDFVSAIRGGDHFDVEHIAGAGVNRRVQVSGGASHRLRVMVTAENVPAQFALFDVWMNEDGVLQCSMRQATGTRG